MSEHYCKVVEVCPSTNIPAGKGVAIKLYENRWNGFFGWYYAPAALNMEMLTLAFEALKAERTVAVELNSTEENSEIVYLSWYNADYKR